METKSGGYEERLAGPLQVRSSPSTLGSNTGSFLTFIIVFIVLFQVYSKENNKRLKKKRTSIKDKEEGYLGIYDLPKLRNSVPLKLIGVLPQLLPLSRTLKRAEEISKECGDLFHAQALMLDFVVFNSGAVVQTLLKSGDFGHVKKLPIMYAAFAPFVTNGLLVSNGAFWQKQRKTLMKSQSYQNLKAYMGMLNRHSKNFVGNLEKLADGKEHTVNDLINTSFLEVITELITGKNMHKSEELRKYHHNFTFWKDTVIHRMLMPFLLLKPFWFFYPRSRQYDKGEAELMEFAKKRLHEHNKKRAADEKLYQNGEVIPEKKAFRSVLDELTDAGVDERQIIDEVDVMMFGGHETGAGTIHCLLFALASNPQIQEWARKEVDEMFEDPINIKNGSITFDAVQTCLKYVERCIFETLRLFPPGFIIGRQLDSPLKVEHKDKTFLLPVGTNVIVCPYMLHRRADIYPEPHKFDPDRFSPEESAKRHAYSYIPFSAGPRNCLGLKFAMIELKTMAAYILRNFEITTKDRMEDIVLMPYTTLSPSKDFTFQFKRRSVSAC